MNPFHVGAQADPSDEGLLGDLRNLWEEPLPDNESSDFQEIPRGAGISQIPGNLLHNIKDIGQGLGVAGSLAGARLLESFPSVNSDGQFQLGQMPVRMSDLDDIGRTMDAVVSDVKTNWVDPLIEGRYEDIYRYAATRPLDFASDVLTVSPLLKGTKAAALAEKMLPAAVSKAKTSPVGTFITGKVEQVADHFETAREIKEGIKARQILAARDKALMEDVSKAHPELQRLYAQINPSERALVMDILTGRHPEVLKNGYANISKEIRAFRDAVERQTEKRLAQLLEMGQVTAEQAHLDRYKPMLDEYLRTVRGISSNVDKLSDSELAALIREVEQYAKRRGIRPVYQARMTDKEIRRILANPFSIPEDIARVLKNRIENGDTTRFSREHARSRVTKAEGFSDDSLKATLASDLQTAQAYHAYKALLDKVLNDAVPISKMSPAQVKLLEEGSLTLFDAKQFFGNVFGEASGLQIPTAVDAIFPEPIAIPTSVLKSFAKVGRWQRGTIETVLRSVANFSRRYVLGFNLLFPEKQFGQNLVMLGMTQFVGPRDAMVSLASYAMAFDKNIQKLIPAEIVMEQFANEIPKVASGKLGKLMQVPDKIADFTFWRTQVLDKYTRTAAAIYYGLKLSEADPALGRIITGMVDSGEAINRLNRTFADPARASQIAKRVTTTLGDYSSLSAAKRANIRSCLLWWMWYEHIVKFTASLPYTNPLKVSLMNSIVRTYPELFQEDVPDGPLKKAGAIMLPDRFNEQDMPMATIGGSLNPWSTLPELVEMLVQPMQGDESSTAIGAMNPLFSYAMVLFNRKNPQTGKSFRDPDMVSMGGHQYKREDLEAGRMIEQEPIPHALEYIMRTFFPPVMRSMERLYAKAMTGGEPSQFTAPLAGRAAPRRAFGTGGEPLAAPSEFDIILQSIIGQRAIPIDIEANSAMEDIEERRYRKAIRAMELQLGDGYDQ